MLTTILYPWISCLITKVACVEIAVALMSKFVGNVVSSRLSFLGEPCERKVFNNRVARQLWYWLSNGAAVYAGSVLSSTAPHATVDARRWACPEPDAAATPAAAATSAASTVTDAAAAPADDGKRQHPRSEGTDGLGGI